MKKTFKSILAITLTLILALSSVSAFAVNEKEFLLWDYYSEGIFEQYYYNGNLTLGENTVSAKNGETFNYFIFDADKAGYYAFQFRTDHIDFMVTPEHMKNGRAIDIDWAVNIDSGTAVIYGEPIRIMLYMEKGENIVGAYFVNKTRSDTVTVDFFGESITDIEFEENAFKDLISGADFHSYEGSKEHNIFLDGTVKFSSGKEIELNNYHFFFTTQSSFISGTAELNLEFFRYSEKNIGNIRKITEYIKDAEFVGLDETPAATAGYFYGYHILNPEFDGFKITYVNGTTEIIPAYYGQGGMVTLENGRSYNVFATILYNENEELCYGIKIADKCFEYVPFYINKVSLAEDIQYIGYAFENRFVNNGEKIGKAFNTIVYNSFSAGDYAENICRFISVLLSESGNIIKKLAEGSVDFIKFHMF